MILTTNQLSRVVTDYSKIAGEVVVAEQIGGTLYIFCSELGTLRLFRAMPNKRQGFSSNLKKFYFSLDL